MYESKTTLIFQRYVTKVECSRHETFDEERRSVKNLAEKKTMSLRCRYYLEQLCHSLFQRCLLDQIFALNSSASGPLPRSREWIVPLLAPFSESNCIDRAASVHRMACAESFLIRGSHKG